jgi:hypothetical protein
MIATRSRYLGLMETPRLQTRSTLAALARSLERFSRKTANALSPKQTSGIGIGLQASPLLLVTTLLSSKMPYFNIKNQYLHV